MSWQILASPVETEGDIVAVRQRARRIAELLGFERQDQTRIATAVSEIARNAVAYASKGRAEFSIDGESRPQSLHIRIADKGEGIRDLDSILDGTYRSPTGMGVGLVGARRLMDHFQIRSERGNGTEIDLGARLPARAERLTKAKLGDLVAILRREQANDPLAALREQNRELMQSLDEIRRLNEEGDRINSELDDTNRGVVALYAELDERAEQLRKASELKSRFLSNMSHEFRTPLNSVLALSRLLLQRNDGPLTVEQERQVEYIRKAADGMLELVNDLLDLAKVEAGKVDVRPTAFSVQSLFGALRGALRPLLNTPAVDLVFDVLDDMPELTTDEPKVAQILRNLISNALKFTENGEVRVTARYEPGADLAIFSVRDTGIGIAPEDQARIFEEFSQVDTGLHRKVQGTGLGLPLSRSLANLLGGELRVESIVSQGSLFTLAIPATLGVPDVDRPAHVVPATASRQVLIIDDDEAFRYVLRQIIGSDARYRIVEARDGKEGLQLAREMRPDVIVLDLQMPHVDGFAVLQEIEKDDRLDMPVIVSTSMPLNEELRSRLPAGTRFIPKNLVSRENVLMFLQDATSAREAA